MNRHKNFANVVRFSPDGKYLAAAAGYRLILRDVDTLQIVQLYSCMDQMPSTKFTCGACTCRMHMSCMCTLLSLGNHFGVTLGRCSVASGLLSGLFGVSLV